MKIIKCDLCHRELGKTVNVGNFQAITMARYSPHDLNNGFYVNSQQIITNDICNECSNRICEAQNKIVEEIINEYTL